MSTDPNTAKPDPEKNTASASPASASPVSASEVEISRLRHEIQRLNQHRFVRIHNSVPRLLLFQFIRGLTFGLGTIIGATLLVSLIARSLLSIDFIPVIGEWAGQLVDIIMENRDTP